MTTTTAPATDWYRTTFAVITATPYPSLNRPTYHTVGHSAPACPARQGDALVTDSSLADLAEVNEHWDGEVEYLAPWPCGTCVAVKGAPASIGFTNPAPTYGDGPAAPKVAADPQAEADEAAARAYLATYTGSFEFLVDMQRRRSFTPKMVAAILRCAARDQARPAAPAATPATEADGNEDGRRLNLAPNAYAGQCRSCRGIVAANAGRREKVEGRWTVLHSTTTECATTTVPAVAPQAPVAPLPSVPDGKYAVTADAGHSSFYQVRTPVAGKWAGFVFVDLLIGSPGDWRHQAVKGAQKATILAKIAVDPQEALARYGREFKQCGACDAPLSHDRSKKAGYGQTCADKRGYAW